MIKTTWKPLKGYEDTYQISSIGQVQNINTSKILSTNRLNHKGYVMMKIGTKSLSLHRLVAAHFMQDFDSSLQVNHIDENKHNNQIGNLNLMTSKENSNHGTRNERISQAHSRAVIATNLTTGEETTYPNTRAAKGFTSSCISRCCSGERARHKNHTWRFANA